jgi:hypothetical protein
MIKQEYDLTVMDKLRKMWKKPREVNVGDIGIFHEVVSYSTRTDISNDLTYDVFAKIKATEVYDQLVEVEILNLKISDSVSQDIVNLITKNFPKYVNPKKVNWQLQKETNIKQ